MNTPVSFELAKLLKEKGFKSESKAFYDGSGELLHYNHSNNEMQRFRYEAPTISEVVMWLYEKHGIWISVSPVFEFNDGRKDYLTLQGYQYYITVITDNKYNQEKTHADRGYKNTPTEAYEAGIEYTLKNLL